MTNYIIAANICFFLSGLFFGIGAGRWSNRAIVARAKAIIAKANGEADIIASR